MVRAIAVGWSDSVRLELEQAGFKDVKVTTVCPYYINTGMFEGAKAAPLLPILEPQDVVDEVWREMKKGAPFVVLPKTVLLVWVKNLPLLVFLHN